VALPAFLVVCYSNGVPLEHDAARAAELAIDQADAAQVGRFVLVYAHPQKGFIARRLGPPPESLADPWVPVQALVEGPDTVAGVEKALSALWPDCPPSLRRTLIMGADLAAKFLRSG
jgi:hypothetical protein